MPSRTISNFGRNLALRADPLVQPRTEAELLAALREHRSRRIRAIGSLHCWGRALEADGVVIDLRHLNSVAVVTDDQGPLARIGGGCQINRALAQLDKLGLTLPALGLITEQTIAGATATGTHGSGRHCLSQYLTAIRVAHYDDADEPVIAEIRGGDALRAARCSLGNLGIVVGVELRPRPSYRIEETLTAVASVGQAVALEAEWPLQQFYFMPWSDGFLVQQRRETDAPRSRLAPLYRWYWLLGIDIGMHLLILLFARWLRSPTLVKWFYRSVMPRLTIRDWRVVDRSQDMLIMEHELFRHIEIEVFVRRPQLKPALAFARRMITEFDAGEGLNDADRALFERLGLGEALRAAPKSYTHHYTICVRRVLPDDTLLAMSSGGPDDWYALSFISYARPHDRAGFFAFAKLLAHGAAAFFNARCHWGKHCPSNAEEIARLYPELPLYRAVCAEFDPRGVFANDWGREMLLGRAANPGSI